ncbi:MAG TPA: ECF-type sigma factor [Rhodothermales bacterium]|nr:ECF-type sigma factor [Rhodothermales bacterium]
MATAPPITTLLAALNEGDEKAMDALFAMVYQELRRLARTVRHQRASETMNTTALVHEAYIKLVGSDQLDVQSRLHFMRVAARAMRQVLVTAAHKRITQKRGGDQAPLSFDDALYAVPVEPAQVVGLDEALQRLETHDPRQVQVVECRFFAGFTIPETAEIMDLSVATVNREWRMARAWLAGALNA